MGSQCLYCDETKEHASDCASRYGSLGRAHSLPANYFYGRKPKIEQAAPEGAARPVIS